MKKLNFTAKQLRDSLSFARDDYNRAVPAGKGYASYNEFIENVMNQCRENEGTLEDAILISEDAFNNLKYSMH